MHRESLTVIDLRLAHLARPVGGIVHGLILVFPRMTSEVRLACGVNERPVGSCWNWPRAAIAQNFNDRSIRFQPRV